MKRSDMGWASAGAVLACWLAAAPPVAAQAELRAVQVLIDQEGGSGRAVELEFSQPIEMRSSRFYIREQGAREFVRVVALPRRAGSPTRVFLVVSPDAGPALEIRWYVQCLDGRRLRGEHNVRFAERTAQIPERRAS